jgi:hypothetical protein
MSKLKFIRLKTLDQECRCCGKGNQHICEKCDEMLHNGYAFFIELKDSSTEERKRPTGYNIALLASQVTEHRWYDGRPSEPMTPGIYFIRQADMKNFLKDDYNNFRATQHTSRVNGRLLNTAPRHRNHPVRQTAGSARQAVELRH